MAIDIVTTQSEDQLYGHIFVGAVRDVDHIKLDTSTLTTAEVDANGYLKPGVGFLQSGVIVTTTAQTIYGVTFEAIKLPGRTSNTTPALSGDTTDPLIAVATGGLINRDLAEDYLGRAYTANELTALTAGGFKVTST